MNDLTIEVNSNLSAKPTEVINSEKTKLKKKWTGKPRPQKFTAKKQKKFLDLLATNCNLKQSALALNISPSTIYKYKQQDPKFREALLATQEAAYETLEAVCLDRAINGSKKTTYDGEGKVVSQVVYHDTALETFLLKFNLPKYRETTQIEITGKNGGPIELSAAKNKLLDILGVTLEGEFEKE